MILRLTLGILLSLSGWPGEALAQAPRAQTAPDPTTAQPVGRKLMRDCLNNAARGRAAVSECDGRVFGRCLDEINKVGGNLGNSAIYVCATNELTVWLSLWAEYLQGRLWTGDGDGAPILERYAQIQAHTAQECLKPPANPLMVTIAKCFASMYGPFLVAEIRRGRTADQVDKDLTDIEKRISGRRP